MVTTVLLFLKSALGAAFGTAICPGIGTVVGGLVGGILGEASGSSVTEKVVDTVSDAAGYDMKIMLCKKCERLNRCRVYLDGRLCLCEYCEIERSEKEEEEKWKRSAYNQGFM